MGEEFTVRALTPGTWAAFAGLVERHHGISRLLVHLVPPLLRRTRPGRGQDAEVNRAP